ncbi:MAG: pirin family protein [candidate division Zixibacteria bacterium]|nr:pirin family protein [candidate division Zixibacteria bacterium]
MINKIPASKRYFSSFGWLKSYWLFSFNSYIDPNNTQFGSLRVFNDDIVIPGKGFSMHSHREMEIVTVILTGTITHEDDIGNKERIKAGEVQVMSAGTGLSHSEYNREDEDLHLYQIWFMPNKRELNPAYQQKDFSKVDRANSLLAVASGGAIDDALIINSNAALFLGNLEPGKQLEHNFDGHKKYFIYVSSGKLQVNEIEIDSGDQARIEDEASVAISALETSEFVLAELW